MPDEDSMEKSRQNM